MKFSSTVRYFRSAKNDQMAGLASIPFLPMSGDPADAPAIERARKLHGGISILRGLG
jgi:hypothetical protein